MEQIKLNLKEVHLKKNLVNPGFNLNIKPYLPHLQSAGCGNSMFPGEVLEDCAAPDEVPPSPADLTMFANEASVELK